MKKIIIIVVAIALLGSGVGIGVGVYNSQPEVVAQNALVNGIQGLAEREEIAPIINMLNSGSMELKADLNTEELDADMPALEADAGVKLYFGSDDIFIKDLYANIEREGEETSIKGEAYFSEAYSYISNSEILNGTVGIIKGEMAKSFTDSFIYETLSKSETEIIEAFIEAYDDNIVGDLEKDLEKISKRYVEFLVKQVIETAEFTAENDKVKIGGERTDARVVTVVITGEDFVEIISELYKEVEEDKELRSTVIKYGDYFENVLIENGVIESGNDIGDAYDEFLDSFEEGVEQIEDHEDDIEDQELILDIVTPKMSSELCKLTAKFDSGYDKTTLFTLDCGIKGIKKTDRIEFSANGESLVYEVKENSREMFESSLKYDDDYIDEVTVFSIEIDKKDDTFKLGIADNEMILRGSWTSKSGTTTIGINKVTIEEESFSRGFEFTIILKEKDRMPAPKKASEVTNIFKLDEEDFNDIMERATEWAALFN